MQKLYCLDFIEKTITIIEITGEERIYGIDRFGKIKAWMKSHPKLSGYFKEFLTAVKRFREAHCTVIYFANFLDVSDRETEKFVWTNIERRESGKYRVIGVSFKTHPLILPCGMAKTRHSDPDHPDNIAEKTEIMRCSEGNRLTNGEIFVEQVALVDPADREKWREVTPNERIEVEKTIYGEDEFTLEEETECTS